MKRLDLKTILKHADKWIATKDSYKVVLASGESIEEVERKLKKQNIKGATLTYITSPDKYISPLCQSKIRVHPTVPLRSCI